MNNQTIKEKIFELYGGRVLVFIDWANVYCWSDGLGWEVDPKRLFDYLSGYPEIIEKRFYHGTEKENDYSVDFIKDVQNIGFKVITKDVKKIPVLLESSHFKNIRKDLFNGFKNIKKVIEGMPTKLGYLNMSEEFYNLKSKEDEIDKKINELVEKICENNITAKQHEIIKNDMKEEYKKREKITKEIDKNFNEEEQMEELFGRGRMMGDYVSNIQGELDSELFKLNTKIDEQQKTLAGSILKRKCNFDCEIVMDIMSKLDEFDGSILFSGDGDFVPLYEFLIKQRKQVIVVCPCRKPRELTELLIRDGIRDGRELSFLPVEELKEFIQKSPPKE